MSAESALGIPLVLEKVVQKLDREDLLRCRLVGPKNLWNREARKLLKQERADLTRLGALSKFNDTFGSSVDGISLTPSQFSLNITKLYDDQDEGGKQIEKEMERFVQIAGDHINELELWLPVGESDFGLVEFLQTLVYNCFPNLNKLVLHVNCVDNDELDYSEMQVNLKSRLDTCEGNFVSNLKELKLFISSSNYFDPSMMESICPEFISFTTELVSNAVNLQSFYLEFTFSDSLSERMMEESLVKAMLPNLASSNLKKITLYPEKTSEECICNLTQHSSLSLEDLMIYQIDTNAVTKTDLRQLLHRHSSNLQELELDFREPSQMRIPLGVPLKKLKWLSIDNVDGLVEWGMIPAIENVELVYRSLEGIIPHVLSYPLDVSDGSLDVRWNSDSQSVFSAKLSEDEPFVLPNPSIVKISKANKKLISFHLIKSCLHSAEENAKISGRYLRSLSSHPVYFPIPKLGIIFDSDTVTLSDLHQFLNRYHTILREMELEFRVPFDVSFPSEASMNKLSDLTLKNFRGSFEWSKLAQLKRVKLDSRSLQAIVPSIITAPSDCKIDSIECFDTEREPEQEDLLVELFTELAPYILPQLTTLKIGQNCTAPLAVIFSSCTGLTSLELVRCRGVTDELLCGTGTCPPVMLPEVPDGDNGEEDYEDDFVLHSQYRALVEEMRICPHIGYLKDLQHLEVNMGRGEDADAFSDISVLCGVIDCEKLETLILQSPNISYKRSSRVLQQANLQNLSDATINYDSLNPMR